MIKRELEQAKLPELESEDPTGMFTLAKLSVVSIDQIKELKEILDGEDLLLPRLREGERELISPLYLASRSFLSEAYDNPSSLTEYLPPLENAISTTALLERVVMEFKEA